MSFLTFSGSFPEFGAIDGGLIPMRHLFAALAFAMVLGGSVEAQAEKRVFIIANNSDGYGIDRCLSTGANCGVAVATAYCRAREYTQAASFRRVDHDSRSCLPDPNA